MQIGGDDREFLLGPRERISDARRTVGVVDLFSGVGGLTLGIEAAAAQMRFGFEVRFAVERDPRVREVYANNFGVDGERLASGVEHCFDRPLGSPLSLAEQTIASKVGSDVDFLVGGPPCQGHSTLNNHTRGDDPRNLLYLSMVRAAEVLRPRAVLIENVPAIERDTSGVLERARRFLEALGYQVATSIVSVASIGVPQRRQRHVLLALLGAQPDIDTAISVARTEEARDVRWAIHDLLGRRGSIYDSTGRLSRENEERATYLIREGLYDLPDRLRPPCQRGPHRYNSMYGRLRWDKPSQTITSGFGSPGQGRYLHPTDLRTLTPHEAARLQFFPDWFDFRALRFRGELARAIGNAVPPKLSFALAHYILDPRR